jgi:hypothetical protein
MGMQTSGPPAVWAGTRAAAMAELQESLGISARMAGALLQLADAGGDVDLGFGQKLRRNAQTDRFEITGQYNPNAR